MIVRPATFPSMYVDADRVFSDADLSTLWAYGIRGIIGYLGLVTKADVARYLDNGFEFLPVTFARKPDSWTPSAALGAADGAQDLALLAELALPVGHHLAHDLEGCKGPAPLTAAWLDARSRAIVVACAAHPMLYVGAEDGGLSGAELYARPYYDLYWKSFSSVPEPTCGWGMIQLYKSIPLAGGEVDVDVPCFDYRDRLPLIVAQH
jgi:hypothetical protein